MEETADENDGWKREKGQKIPGTRLTQQREAAGRLRSATVKHRSLNYT